MNPNKRGRPPLPSEQRRTIVVRQRVTQAEYRVLQAEARKEGISVAAFVRAQLLAHARPERPAIDQAIDEYVASRLTGN